MQFKELKKEQIRENLVPILVIVVVFFLSVTVFRPILRNSLQLRLENKKLREQFESLNKKSQLLQSLDEVEVTKRVAKMEEVFPSEKPILNLIASLSQLAKEKNVTFGGITLNPGTIKISSRVSSKLKKREPSESEAKKAGLQDFLINFVIEGKIENITAFISGLETTTPLMKIESFTIALEKGSASLNVRVYYQTLPEMLGEIDKPVPLLTEKEKEILDEITHYRKIEPIKTISPVGKDNIFNLPFNLP